MNKPLLQFPTTLNAAPISDWQFREVIQPTKIAVDNELIILEVPEFLQERRIYLYLEVRQTTTGPYLLGAEIEMLLHRTPVGKLPASIGDFTGVATNQSVFSLMNGGGSPNGDSLVLRLAQPDLGNPFANATATLQPLRVNGQINQLRLKIISFANPGAGVTAGLRAFLGCLSTKY